MLFVISLLIVLSVLITVHEFGHFIAAKSVGIAVPRFSLGFGKRLWGFKWGETDFVVSAIPLGGYVKMAGMEDDEAATALEGVAPEEPVDPERTFDAKPLWARAWVISAGVILNFLFAILVYAVVALAYGETRHPITRVAGADPSTAPEVAALVAPIPYGARVTAVGGEPVADWEALLRALGTAPAGPVELRLENAPPVTLDLPADQEARVALMTALQPVRPPVISQVEGGSPAARAGLKVGDRVVEAAGKPVRDWNDLVGAIRGSPGRALPLVVERGGARLPVTATPEAVDGRDAAGETVRVGRLGAGAPALPVQHRRVGPGEALALGATGTWATTAYIARTLKQLVTGEISARNMGGLLTIGEASAESARQGMESFLIFMALFSVNLAVLNLLPIPILDGGHLMFLAIEAVRGRPLSVETRIRLSHVGLIIVVGLMLWANGNDVVRKIEQLLG
ncbi:MAG TPA: RIP metalloprotease RseP [Longimicrobium sp.]|nr:RIP metalloprotease RseP [Longimicrobium sp.]